MCEPVTVAMMGMAAVAQAYSAQQAARAQAQAARQNAEIARRAAADAVQRGQFAAAREREKASLLIGRQEALIGSSGAAFTGGTTSLIIADTLAAGELDAINALNNGMREAWGFEAQASQFDFEASAARKSGKIAVATSLIGGASSIASSGLLKTK